jgi:hypothetical protein
MVQNSFAHHERFSFVECKYFYFAITALLQNDKEPSIDKTCGYFAEI